MNRYKNDESIYLISADSRGPEAISMKEDYCLCKYPTVWGWASWANVWSKYDSEITDWPNMKSSLIKSISKHKSTRRFWIDIFNKMYNKQIDTWDFQLSYLLLKNNGKCIVPRVNQVTTLDLVKAPLILLMKILRLLIELRITLNSIVTQH